MKIEITACANGWIVRPAYDHSRADYYTGGEMFVFNDAKELGAHISQWGKDNLQEPKKCNCK